MLLLTFNKQVFYKLPGCEEVADADEALYVTSRRILAELSENDLVRDYNEGNDEQQVFNSNYGGESDAEEGKLFRADQEYNSMLKKSWPNTVFALR